jgi:8-oxo-dGTP pyrophosphatase MutT (NUDIX family)
MLRSAQHGYPRRVIDLVRVRAALASYAPRLLPETGARQAAVAMLLRHAPAAPEVLLIERARREGDPWSGHMAFPGGRVEISDEGVQRAAERETFEEVGIDLADAELLGRLDDLEGRDSGRTLPLVISAFVYHVHEPAPIEPSPEVESALWIPVAALADPARHVDYAYRLAGGALYPGIVVGDPERHVVWGLTYRFLEIFFQALERPLPDRWQALR